MDIGKSLCCLYGEKIGSQAELREKIESGSFQTPSCRWIGVPTTSGTGSEVTCWATMWDSKRCRKYSVETAENYAACAVADPDLTGSMPTGITVSSALDAIAHAAESYWAKATNAVSRTLSLEAIRMLTKGLVQILNRGKNEEIRDQLSKGSMLAGLAFSNTRTTACHSILYPLTMQYHIPHGVAVSLLLGPVLELNGPAVREKERLMDAFGVATPEELNQKIQNTLQYAGYPVTLHEWGVKEEALSDLASRGMTKGRADNNPVRLNESVVSEILKKVF